MLEADPQTKMKTEINVVKLFDCYMKRGTCTMTSKQTLRGYCFDNFCRLSKNKWMDMDIKINTEWHSTSAYIQVKRNVLSGVYICLYDMHFFFRITSTGESCTITCMKKKYVTGLIQFVFMRKILSVKGRNEAVKRSYVLSCVIQ